MTIAEVFPEYFVGLDLGQAEDFTAVAVLERAKVTYTAVDAVTRQRKWEVRHRLVAMERLELATTYPDIVARVEEIVRGLTAAPSRGNVARAQCTVVPDATGVGAPVVDMLRATRLPAMLVPVQITAGDGESRSGETYRVPKRDLVVGLQAMLQQRMLQVPAALPVRHELTKELLGMRAKIRENQHVGYAATEGLHDDLVMALALAVWRAKGSVRKSAWGPGRLV